MISFRSSQVWGWKFASPWARFCSSVGVRAKGRGSPFGVLVAITRAVAPGSLKIHPMVGIKERTSVSARFLRQNISPFGR